MAHVHRTESRTSPRRIKATERQQQALELRKAGATFLAIASAVGYRSAQAAQFGVESALRKTLQEPADVVRQLDLERLGVLLLAVWPKARTGDLDAVDRALKILKQRGELLGYDVYKPSPQFVQANQQTIQVLIQVADGESVSLAEFRRAALGIVAPEAALLEPLASRSPGHSAECDTRL